MQKTEDYPSQPLSCCTSDESLHADAGTLIEVVALVDELIDDLNVLILTVLLCVHSVEAVKARLSREDGRGCPLHVGCVVVVARHHKGRVLRLRCDLVWVVGRSQVTLCPWNGLRLSIAA